jgi:hypothetical protein
MNDTIPTISSVEEATDTLHTLAHDHDRVSVFWDRGWGDSGQTADITIMVDGNGNDPKVRITDEVYRTLIAENIIGGNTYGGFKKRRIHDFKTPQPEERTDPTSNEVAEQVIIDLMVDHADLPIRASFWRGIRQPGEFLQTPAAGDGWFVMLIPGHSDVAMSAQEPTILGPDIIGGGIADCLQYPRNGSQVDVAALAGDEVRAELLDAIRAKVAVISAAQSGA